jgi:hypothetical protein
VGTIRLLLGSPQDPLNKQKMQIGLLITAPKKFIFSKKVFTFIKIKNKNYVFI